MGIKNRAYQTLIGTTEDWLAYKGLLGPGEPAYDTTVGRYKYGNGTDRWVNLPYSTKQDVASPKYTKLKKMIAYRPSKSTYPEWATSLISGVYSWSDVDTDIEQIKGWDYDYLRLLVHYDHQERAGQPGGWVRNGVLQPAYADVLEQMFDRIHARGLRVVLTAFQSAPSLKPTDNWDWMENDLAITRAYVIGLANRAKVSAQRFGIPTSDIVFNPVNEPDGYGVSNDPALFGRVLTFLHEMREAWLSVIQDGTVVVNTSTHDTLFRRVKSNTPGVACIADVSDWIAFNSFRWIDTGQWPGTSVKTQIPYATARAGSKPVWLFESGFPYDYVNQGAGQESLVPSNDGIFDRPQGRAGGVAHTPANQARALQETAYHVWSNQIHGWGVWSAFNCDNPPLTSYHDSFGIGSNWDSYAAVRDWLSGKFDGAGTWRISLQQGTKTGGALINGIDPVATTSTDYVKAGVLLPAGSSWTSETLPVSAASRLRIGYSLDTDASAATTDEPFIIRFILSSGKMIDFRWKRYTANAFQMIVASGGDTAIGWLPVDTMTAGAKTFEVNFGADNWKVYSPLAPTVFTTLQSYETDTLKISVIANANSPKIRLTDLHVLGTPGDYVNLRGTLPFRR